MPFMKVIKEIWITSTCTYAYSYVLNSVIWSAGFCSIHNFTCRALEFMNWRKGEDSESLSRGAIPPVTMLLPG